MLEPATKTRRNSFFVSLLTKRHLLTRRASIGVGLALLLVASAFWLWRQQSMGVEPAEQSPPAASRLLEVATSTFAESGPANLYERYVGIVVPRRTSQLAAKALGRVERVHVDIGDEVRPGDLLIQLDEEQLKAELAVVQAQLAAAGSQLDELRAGPRRQDIEQAEARVSELEANLLLSEASLKRTVSLRDSQAVSAQELDERRFQVDAMRAQLAAARQQLDLLKEGTRIEQLTAQENQVAGLEAQLNQIQIRLSEQRVQAPYAGRIQQRMVDEGEVVAAGQVLLEVLETEALEVHVGLPADRARVLAGDGALEFQLMIPTRDGENGARLDARLDRVAPGVQANTRTRQCIFRLGASSAGAVGVGDAIEVRIPRTTRIGDADGGSFWVPSQALTAGPRGLWMLMVAVDDDRQTDSFVIESRPVELLSISGQWSQVRGPVEAGEQFVTQGVHRVVAGQRVRLAADSDQHNPPQDSVL